MPDQVRQERRPPRTEVDEVAAGVLRLQLPISLPGLGHVNCYILEDSRGLTLIDPGLPGWSTWQHLKKGLASIGAEVKHVHTVIVTHSHPDHFGQVPRLKQKAGAEIIAHSHFRTILDPDAEADDEEPPIVSWIEDSEATNTAAESSANDSSTQLLKRHVNDHPYFSLIPRATPWGGKPYEAPLSRRLAYSTARRFGRFLMGTPTPTRRVEDAEILELGGKEWVAVHTPGHTPDHLCLWAPAEGVMISGDHVLPTITPHISGLSNDLDPLADFMSSLEQISQFKNVKTVLPAHGLTFANLTERAQDIQRHHLERLELLRKAGAERGPGTVKDYMEILFKPRSWGSMAESETYAHLKHLALIGQAEVIDKTAQLQFSIKG